MTFEKLVPYLEKRQALSHALGLLSFDRSTVGIKKASKDSAKTMSFIKKELLMLSQDQALYNILKECLQEEKNTFIQKRIAEEWLDEIEREKDVPTELALNRAMAINEAATIWPSCKHNNDFKTFAPYVQKVIDYTKAIAKIKQKENQSLYDVCLENYLPGFNTQILDEFFELLKKEIVPLLKEINSLKNIDDSVLHQKYDVDKQQKYVRDLIGRLGFDFNCGEVFESEHPFTTHFNNHDVRFTNHFHNDSIHAIFSGMHETGHALYEMGIGDNITHTPLGTGTSTPMHEGQSRFYENMIGRNILFWENEYPKLQEQLPENFKDTSLETFYKAINKIQAGLIRIDADELTYSLHIMIRYEIEKEMINNDIAIEELPTLWNKKIKKFLDIEVPNDTQGVLQDMHWGSGLIGYFPGYSLGSAVAAQLYNALADENIESWIKNQEYLKINQFLKDNIYQHGSVYTTDELLVKVCKEKFNPKYYVDYLLDKFKGIYNIK